MPTDLAGIDPAHAARVVRTQWAIGVKPLPGHLVMHPAKSTDDAAQEKEADRFASEFLMPREVLPAYLRRNPTTDDVLQVRSQLKVSAMALTHALRDSGRMSDWHHRQMCVDLSGKGYRSGEPGGMEAHEMSKVFPPRSSVEGGPQRG